MTVAALTLVMLVAGPFTEAGSALGRGVLAAPKAVAKKATSKKGDPTAEADVVSGPLDTPAPAPQPEPPPPAPVVIDDVTHRLGVEDCVRIALDSNGRIMEAEGRVHEYQARLAQVEALFYPRIAGMAFLAPMYTVRGDINAHTNEWKSLSDWGPYAHLQATLAQPIFTFGRADAAKNAASERAEVEKGRLREAQNTVAWEVRKLYYTHLYARSLIPTLEQALGYVEQALKRAQELYDTGEGEVSQSDLSRLRFSLAQVRRFLVTARNAQAVALVALKHTMGMAATANLDLAEDKLPPIPEEPNRELASYIADAAANRPEWQQLAHGKAAAKSLSVAEIKANLPVLAIAGQFEADWAPTRDNARNPYWNDPYNRVAGGLALALLFDLNPWAAQAKSDAAEATYEQLDALERFASTGIPLQVQMAYTDLKQAREIFEQSTEAIQATRKWVTFSANAYDTGTGEPRDLLEGLAALVESRRMMYDALRDYYLARAGLLYATGSH